MARILLIDDDDVFRGTLGELLLAEGHAVSTASDGAKGAKLFRSAPYDVVITDLIMDGGEGLETVMRVRREYPEIAVIAMSGFSNHSELYLEVAKRFGAHRTFVKPFSALELQQAIRDLCSGRTALDRAVVPSDA